MAGAFWESQCNILGCAAVIIAPSHPSEGEARFLLVPDEAPHTQFLAFFDIFPYIFFLHSFLHKDYLEF